jgi:hypothetical protein
MNENKDYLEYVSYKDEHISASLKVEDYKKNNQLGIIENYWRNDENGIYTRETTITFSMKEAKEILDDLRYFRSFISEYFRNLGQLDHLENDLTFGEIIKKSKDLDVYILDYFCFPKVSRNKFLEDMLHLPDDGYYDSGLERYENGKGLQINLLSHYLEKYLKQYYISYEKKCIPVHQGYYED